MSEIHPRARRSQRTYADDAAEQFDSSILANRVHDRLLGSHSSGTEEDPLGQVLDTAERAHDLADCPSLADTATVDAAVQAGDRLADHASDVVTEQTVRACAVVLRDGEHWTDLHEPEAITKAQAEALEFINSHREAAATVGVLEDLPESSFVLDREQAIDLIESRYNDGISVYTFDDHFRVTNGSGGMYADIAVEPGQLVFDGKRYGETFEGTCAASKEALFEMLSRRLGL